MSYGVNAPQGLVPSKMLGSSTFNNQAYQRPIGSGYNTSIFTGDPVTWGNAGGIVIGATSTGIIGVFAGCQYFDTNGNLINSKFWRAGTVTMGGAPAIAWVYEDPNIIYDIQLNGGTDIIISNLGNNANFVAGAGNTLSGLSGYMLDSGTMSANNPTYNLKILDITPVPGNAFGIQYANALCIINNHVYKGGTGTNGL